MTHRHWPSSEKGGISNGAGLMLMTVILLLAFALGANGLNADVIWADELSSVTHMGAFNPPYTPMQVMESIFKHARDHVPLYYLLGAGWSQIAGWSQFALRLMSCFFGVLMVAWLYRFAADAVNRRTALAAAFLMATNAFVIIYFHELRAYTLLLLLAIIHTWYYWRLAAVSHVSRLTWILFVFSAAAVLYTHILGFVALAGLGVTHIFMERHSHQSRVIIVGWGMSMLFFVPYLPTVLSGSFTWGETKQAVAASELAGPFWLLLTNGLHVLALPLVLSLVYRIRRKRHPTVSRWLLLVIFIGLALGLVGWRFDLLATSRMRYFLLLWFPCMILFAYSVTSLPHSLKLSALFMLIWCLSGFQFARSEQILEFAGYAAQGKGYPPLHRFTALLQGQTGYRDHLLGFSESLALNENREGYDWSIADYYLQAQLGIDGGFLHASLKRYRLEQDVRGILREHPHVLLAHDPSDVPPNYARALEIIQGDYVSCALLVDKPDLLVQRYVHPVMDCGHEPVPLAYENGVRVVDRAARYVPESDLVQILTWWEAADEGLLDEYNVSMQIITLDWQNVRQEDRHLYELPPWDVIELSTADLSPGDYRLAVILYHRDTGEKVSGADPTTGETAKIWPILEFAIESVG